MFGRFRPLVGALWRAPAKVLLRWGVSPNVVTIVGTVGVVLGAVLFLPQGGSWLFWGALAVTISVMTDMLDGTMARLGGRTTRLGAYLDSTLDRVADAAIFGSLTWAFIDVHRPTALAALLCLAIGSFVPYARARAESLGVDAKMGIAERSDRLVVALVATAVVGLGAPLAILTWALILLAVAAAITVLQRTWAVVRADRSAANDTPAES